MIPSNLLSFHSPLPTPLPSLPNPLPANPNPSYTLSLPHRRAGRSRCWCRRGVRASWDSNAEPDFSAGRFRFRDGEGGEHYGGDARRGEKRRWWTDDSDEDEVDDDFNPFDDDDDDPVERPFWDMIWIFKVFKSYGYLLPAIIASMLLATGPKAFLMALALPLGQSAISLAINKIWGKSQEGPRTKPKGRRPFTRTSSNNKRQWQDESANTEKGKQDFKSWVSEEAGVAERGSGSSGSSLGGWDELDRLERITKSSARSKPSAWKGSFQSELAKKGKLSKRGRYRDVPLFLRLLIAVFPFLGSWTRILW